MAISLKKGRPECNYHDFEQKWMKGVIDTDEFILALGTIDLGELPPPQTPKREVPSLIEPVNKFCRKILREIKTGSQHHYLQKYSRLNLKTPLKIQAKK